MSPFLHAGTGTFSCCEAWPARVQTWPERAQACAGAVHRGSKPMGRLEGIRPEIGFERADFDGLGLCWWLTARWLGSLGWGYPPGGRMAVPGSSLTDSTHQAAESPAGIY